MKRFNLQATKSKWVLGVVLSTFIIASCTSSKSNSSLALEEKNSIPETNYAIPSSLDTTIFGPQGTRIFIEKETFQFPDGTPVTGSIVIQVKEFYKKTDMVLGDLSTQSDGKLLETGGMLNITASSGGREVEIKSDKRIVVHFPKRKNANKEMKLFYPKDKIDSTVKNWEIDTISLVKEIIRQGAYSWERISSMDTAIFKFIPKGYVDSGYYWNPLDKYLTSFNFSKQTMKEVKKCNYMWDVKCKIIITTKGEIKNPIIATSKLSESVKRELLECIRQIPALKPGTNNKGEIVERVAYLYFFEDNIPLYRCREEYMKSFDRKYASFENKPVKSVDDAELDYYIFSVAKLGWINCDRFLDLESTTDVAVKLPVDANTRVKMVLSDISGVLMADSKNGEYVFSNVPIGKKATIVVIKHDQGRLMTAFRKYTIDKNPISNIDLKETTLGELRSELNKLN